MTSTRTTPSHSKLAPTKPAPTTLAGATPSRRLGIGMAIFTAFMWALLAIKLKLTLKYIDAYSIVWFRMSFAFLFLSIIKIFKAPKEFSILRAPPWTGIVASLGLGLNYLFYMKGVEYTSPSNAQILIQLAPMGLIIVGIFIFKERPRKIQVLGFSLALIGFALFYKDQFNSTNLSQKASFQEGNLWLVTGACCWIVFAALQKPLLQKYDAQQLNLLLYGVGSLMLSPFNHWASFLALPISGWLLLIACGLNTVLAYGALPIAFKNIPTSQVSVIIAANPLLTIFVMSILSYFEFTWITAEHIAGLGYFAAALVVFGVILALQSRKIKFA